MSSKPQHLRPAFSRFELILVVAILGVTAALAIPRPAKAIASYAADAAARRIAAEMDYARSQAIATGRPITVCLDAAGRSLRISDPAPGGTPSTCVDFAEAPYRATSLRWHNQPGRNPELGTSPLPVPRLDITFAPTGTASTSALITIRADGIARTISLDSSTGKTSAE